MTKLPKPWRVKRGKKLIGAYHVTIDGVKINLRTQDANEAIERTKLAARHGKRDFRDEAQEAAAATVEALSQGGSEPAGAHTPEQAGSTPAPATTAAPPSPAGTAPPLATPPAAEPRAEQPAANAPPPRSTTGWADDAQAGAEAAAGSSDSAPPPPAAPTPQIDPRMLDAMFKVVAKNMVQLQLTLQARAIKWRSGRVCKPLPDAPGFVMALDMAVEAWATQLKIWIPLDQALPPWAMALIAVGSLGFVQYGMSEKPKVVTPGGGGAREQPIQDGVVVEPVQQAA